ncbi:hypothetical protein J7F03_03265 [Streptomyces sp. ISL-43]|uniref:hypothetical protein n=1 Tax=Streptomyces sp. ISL-43 TaxID=2819183 RepID=UPI001BE5783F|nr:hypothetical protein [Streptomyces sp. ISL-43]MBT2446125.1 hypothetical protein [Streptomyces sp. ISL-43]
MNLNRNTGPDLGRDLAPGLDPSRDPRAFIAPLVSSLLTLPLGAVALFFVALSPMACDSCGDTASDRFDASYGVAFTVFAAGLLLVLGLLVAAWALPWERRNSGRRVVLALTAPAAVALDYAVFYGIVDWP